MENKLTKIDNEAGLENSGFATITGDICNYPSHNDKRNIDGS